MSWVGRRGITVWDGGTFPEPTDEELAPYDYPVPRRVQPCGTPAAYKRHQREGTPICEACAEAKSVQRLQNRLAATMKKEGAA